MIGKLQDKAHILNDYFLGQGVTPAYREIVLGMEEDLMRFKDNKAKCLNILRQKSTSVWQKIINTLIQIKAN